MNWFYWFIWRSVRTVFQLLFGFKPINWDLVPKEGPVIAAGNHQSYFDPPMLAVAIKREMHFFAKKELFGVFILGWLIRKLNAIPVRRGIYDPASLSRVSDALDTGGGLIMFPEGTRGDGKEFLKPKPGIGLIAKQSKATIVPVYIYRSDHPFQALFLRRRVKLLFGEPIPREEIDGFADDKAGYRLLAETVMKRISDLKQKALTG
jgi:1-acyl-sn-glycerol-3-phosphate acyltransferase